MGIGTLRQYEQAMRAESITANGISGAEYDRAYPPGCRREMWIRAAEEFVRGGGTLTRFEADALHREGVNVIRLAHGYDSALPAGYLPPDVRQMNANAAPLYKHLNQRKAV